MTKPYLNEQDHRWYVDIKREHTEPTELLKAKMLDLSIGKHILAEIRQQLQIYQGTDLVKKGFEKELTRFLDRRYPWEL